MWKGLPKNKEIYVRGGIDFGKIFEVNCCL